MYYNKIDRGAIMIDKNSNSIGEKKEMPANVMEAIETQINCKTTFEEAQEKRLTELIKLKNSNDQKALKNEKKKIIIKLKNAGILDNNSKLSKAYRP